MKDNEWDKILRIKTTGRDDTNSDTYRYPYEPTDYVVLERLVREGIISKNNTLLDYGCGKGRVSFFLSYETKCKSIGIEYDERIYSAAMTNRETAVSNYKTEFVNIDAKDYKVPEQVDRVFFFNPFSEELLKKVLTNILDSYYEHPREVILFFYYPSDDYIACLMQENMLTFVDEIDCSDLFDRKDERERIMIFEIER